MSRPIKCIAALLFFFLAGLKPIAAQSLVPEFFIAVAPSVVTVVQGEHASLNVAITCNTSSFIAVAECNARPEFDLYLSEVPDGTNAQTAAGRIGANTISISASSEARVGSFPIQVTVLAGDTMQVQTFVLTVRERPTPSSVTHAVQPPIVAPAGPALIWEHHVLVAKTPEEFDRKANDLGQDSWELVSVITRQNGRVTELVGFFKRPKR
jgi:hypothetical protein